MENLSSRLRRKSTLRDNAFDYSIKKDPSLSPEPTIILNDCEFTQITPETSILPPPRRPIRIQTLFPYTHPPMLKQIIFHSPTIQKNFPELDFTKSLNSPNKHFSPKSESISSFSHKPEKAQTPKLGQNPRFFEENKEIAEISPSQDFSIPECRPKCSNRQSRTCSVSFDIVNGTILQSPIIKLNPFVKDVSITEAKSEQTLENDKISDGKCVEVNQMRIKIRPSQPEILLLSFEEALKGFDMQNDVYTETDLWITGLKEHFCCCFIQKSELSAEFLQICEKIIVFAYAGFDSENAFHASLLVSVFNSLQTVMCGKLTWVEVGFSSNSPYDKDLKHNVASFGLLLILFLYEFIPSTLMSMLQYCCSIHLAFVPLAFDVTEIVLLTLRKKKLNSLMNQTQKCLEIVCFFFAGCLVEWFSLHKDEMGSIRRVNEVLETQAFRQPESFINLARNLLKFQM